MTEPKRGYIAKQVTLRDPEDNRLYSAQRMTCAKCSAYEDIKVGGDMRNLPKARVRRASQLKGWDVRSNKAYCPDCKKDHQHDAAVVHVEGLSKSTPPWLTQKADPPTPIMTIIPKEEPPMAAPQPLQATDIDRATKRRIHELIGDNWDDRAQRYIAAASDQTVADELKVPRKWVEDIRIEWFGDNGGNAEIEELKKDIKVYIDDAEKMIALSLENATKWETAAKTLRSVQSRLERIEKSVLPRR